MEGQAHSQSAEAREQHPPNEHAADAAFAAEQNAEHAANAAEATPNEHAPYEAFLGEQNAENQNLRDDRRTLREANRGERGPDQQPD